MGKPGERNRRYVERSRRWGVLPARMSGFRRSLRGSGPPTRRCGSRVASTGSTTEAAKCPGSDASWAMSAWLPPPAVLDHQVRAWKARGTGRKGAKLLLNIVKRGCRLSGVSVMPDVPVAKIIGDVFGEPPRRPRVRLPQPHGQLGRFMRRDRGTVTESPTPRGRTS